MGLIRAAKDAVSSMMADQWREYFYCDSLSNDVLVVKGQQRVTNGRNSNTKGVENIISNGSIVAVNEGQCMIIVDQGGIVEFCADAGEFVYDSSTEPSLFYGNLGESVKNTFSNIGKRFTFGGNAAKDQRIYFFNIKEIMNNLFGTASPIPFRVIDQNIGCHPAIYPVPERTAWYFYPGTVPPAVQPAESVPDRHNDPDMPGHTSL